MLSAKNKEKMQNVICFLKLYLGKGEYKKIRLKSELKKSQLLFLRTLNEQKLIQTAIIVDFLQINPLIELCCTRFNDLYGELSPEEVWDKVNRLS